MTEDVPQKIPIQHVLSNVCDELAALGRRLQNVERLLFDDTADRTMADRLQEMQDIDLIIQQIADLGRAIRVVADVELDGAQVASTVLGDKLHLNDLRLRLLGMAEDHLIDRPREPREILMF